MDKIISLMLVASTIALVNAQVTGKVGINTNAPEKELSVNGAMKTSGMFFKDPLEKLGAKEGYTFIIKSPSPENKITAYNDTFVPNSPAPINLIQYKITCDTNDKDWVNEYDTKINSNKFLVVISSFGFTEAVKPGLSWLTPVPQIYAYYTNGTWKLKADYESFTPDASLPAGTWTLNLLVFDRAYTKEVNSTKAMGTSTTGAATAPLIQ